MSMRHSVTLHHVIPGYNDIFYHMVSVKQDLAKKWTQWKHESFFAVKLSRQKLSKS
jgi:hypothetical protein